ncbi:MAG: molybdopterin converting factor subunit 1 [Rhizobiaceae bacterium]|nr:molybdopterin converting factor subunit 1 [Rhizobiaceae bacterium]
MKILYFAWIKERVGFGEEDIDLPAEVKTIDNLFTWLRGRGEEFEAFLEQPDIIRVALDQVHAPERDTSLAGVREIALFPPMTGG